MTALLFFSIVFNFYLGGKIQNSIYRKKYLVFGIASNLLLLIAFKYTFFLGTVLNDIISVFFNGEKISVINILLPIGISFYTFHNISYIVDVYKKRISPTKNFLTFAIYDLFFPLLLSGPIERAENLIPQIESDRKIEFSEFSVGFFLFLWGIFKKVYVADNLVSFVNVTLEPSQKIPTGIIYYSAFAFAFQVYADFSGYSDAARGLAKMIGFRLSHNFALPFFSSNPSEFWKRWHISLSTWLRDYLYIPLGGNKFGLFRQNISLMVVWILGGLWHGATYGYLIWGAYCGLQIVLYNLFSRYIQIGKERIPFFFQRFLKFFGVILTFWFFALGLLLFRVENSSHLFRIVSNLFGLYVNFTLVCKLFLFVSPVFIVQVLQLYKKEMEIFSFKKIHPVIFVLICIIFCIQFSLFGVFESKEFFYFQF